MSWRTSPAKTFNTISTAFVAAVGRLDKSLNPQDTLDRLRAHQFSSQDLIYVFHIVLASFWLTLMTQPGYPLKLVIPILYTIALLIPFTSQFFIPATPVFAWVITYYSSRFIPKEYRPTISVSLLPTLESVLYGANISDILTRVTHPLLDILAWLPYGVLHFTLPFVVAIFLWLFRPKEALHFWGRAFGYMNLAGVIVQILLPCSAPWYELVYGLTPANYDVPGFPGGLARIDALFGGKGYQATFAVAPVVFGAFPSLHAGCATIEALTWSHFFPQTRNLVWAYTGILYWSTMYLTHHYLIDVVGGACLATAAFYIFLPDELKGANATAPPSNLRRRTKHEIYDLAEPRYGRRSYRGMSMDEDLSDGASSEDEDITSYRSPNPTPNSGTAFVTAAPSKSKKRDHKHTASIASLIRAEDRVEDGWSPIGGRFVFPPTPDGRDGSQDRV